MISLLENGKGQPDSDWPFLSEHESIEEVARIARNISEHGEVFGPLLNHDGDLDYAEQLMKEGYCGEWKSSADYIEDVRRESHEVPEWLDCYIDWDRMAHDWEANGYLLSIEVDGAVHLFSER